MLRAKNIFILILIVVLVGIVGMAIYNYSQLPSGKAMRTSLKNVSTQSFDDSIEKVEVDGADEDDTETLAGARIKVEPAFFDFGKVVYGEVAEHTFTIQNIGDDALKILRLSTSCGCTKAYISDEEKTIDPGMSVSMVVSFDPAVHKDDSDLGEVTRIVYIKTNDPKNPEIEVEIKANVVKESE